MTQGTWIGKSTVAFIFVSFIFISYVKYLLYFNTAFGRSVMGYPKGTQDWDFEQNKRLLQNGSTRNPSCKWDKMATSFFPRTIKWCIFNSCVFILYFIFVNIPTSTEKKNGSLVEMLNKAKAQKQHPSLRHDRNVERLHRYTRSVISYWCCSICWSLLLF